jgi:NAD(P)-dependent dehydrogenase (short-subunit alcohol dehydrogenase family)
MAETKNLGPVLVTGASSGIGRETVLALARMDAEVFASVRRAEDAEKLRADCGGSSQLRVVRMDVADEKSIHAAAEEVENDLGNRGLAGLVNVAGIGSSGPLEYMPLEELRYVYEVNVFGQMAVTQAFLPALRKGGGRIVNITSVGAHIAIPFGGALCSSKAAFGSLNDSLRLELRPFGIPVIAIEPGAIYTPAVEKTLGNAEKLIAKLPPEGAARYGRVFRGFTARAKAREEHGSPPSVVADVIVRALTDPHPRTRYITGKDARMLVTLPRFVPDRVLDWLRARMLGVRSSPAAAKQGDAQKAA